jgi:hypothetical protein
MDRIEFEVAKFRRQGSRVALSVYYVGIFAAEVQMHVRF